MSPLLGTQVRILSMIQSLYVLAGVIGGKFLERGKVAKPKANQSDPSVHYQPEVFFISSMGKIIKQLCRTFTLEQKLYSTVFHSFLLKLMSMHYVTWSHIQDNSLMPILTLFCLNCKGQQLHTLIRSRQHLKMPIKTTLVLYQMKNLGKHVHHHFNSLLIIIGPSLKAWLMAFSMNMRY